MTVKKISSIGRQPLTAGEHAWIQELIDSDEGPNFAMRQFSIELVRD